MKMDSVVYRAATAVEINHDLDGESRQPFIISSLTVACVLSTATVIARLYTRLFVLRTFGRDDFAIGVAQVLTLMTAAAIYLGKHTRVRFPFDTPKRSKPPKKTKQVYDKLFFAKSI